MSIPGSPILHGSTDLGIKRKQEGDVLMLRTPEHGSPEPNLTPATKEGRTEIRWHKSVKPLLGEDPGSFFPSRIPFCFRVCSIDHRYTFFSFLLSAHIPLCLALDLELFILLDFDYLYNIQLSMVKIT